MRDSSRMPGACLKIFQGAQKHSVGGIHFPLNAHHLHQWEQTSFGTCLHPLPSRVSLYPLPSPRFQRKAQLPSHAKILLRCTVPSAKFPWHHKGGLGNISIHAEAVPAYSDLVTKAPAESGGFQIFAFNKVQGEPRRTVCWQVINNLFQ